MPYRTEFPKLTNAPTLPRGPSAKFRMCKPDCKCSADGTTTNTETWQSDDKRCYAATGIFATPANAAAASIRAALRRSLPDHAGLVRDKLQPLTKAAVEPETDPTHQEQFPLPKPTTGIDATSDECAD